MKLAAVIVAHPDDEIIWCGGLILQNPTWDWTIMSMSRADDPSRGPRFSTVCAHLDAAGIISDLDDSPTLAPINPHREIGMRIMEHLPQLSWDLVLTHGAEGEYGHPRHGEVHAEVLRLARAGMIRCEEVWTFACRCDTGTAECTVDADADVVVRLSDRELAEKRRIVHEIYGYREDSFEARACAATEGFTRHLMKGSGPT